MASLLIFYYNFVSCRYTQSVSWRTITSQKLFAIVVPDCDAGVQTRVGHFSNDFESEVVQKGGDYLGNLLPANSEELAAKLDISKQKVCDYEKGRRLQSMEATMKWAKKLKKPHEIWGRAHLQQQVDEADLKLKVDIKAVS